MLKSIGAWNHMDERRVPQFRKMQVWELKGNGYIKFASKDEEEPLAWVAETKHIIGSVYK